MTWSLWVLERCFVSCIQAGNKWKTIDFLSFLEFFLPVYTAKHCLILGSNSVCKRKSVTHATPFMSSHTELSEKSQELRVLGRYWDRGSAHLALWLSMNQSFHWPFPGWIWKQNLLKVLLPSNSGPKVWFNILICCRLFMLSYGTYHKISCPCVYSPEYLQGWIRTFL